VVVATKTIPVLNDFSIVNPLVERLPGVELPHVVHAWDVLRGGGPAGGSAVVLDDDGGRYAAGVCEVLLDRGVRVELVSRFNALFPGTTTTLDLATLYQRLLSKGLEHRLNSWALSVDQGGVTVFNLFTGAETALPADAVVLVSGPKADDGLYFALKGAVDRLLRIGDCHAPRKLDHAIYEGELAGREIVDWAERAIYEGELERLPATV
jgi:hypothetical protein